MNKGPSLFSDFGKKARDLLIGDFNADQKLSVSTYTSAGVVYTSPQGRNEDSGDSERGFVRYKNTLVDVKFDTDLTIATTFTFTDIFPSTRALASVKLPEYDSGKLEVQYFHYHATFTAAVAPKQSPDVDLSVTLGNPTLAFGAEARYKTSTGKLTMCTAGIGLTMPDDSLAVILGDKGDSLKVSFVKNVEKWKGTTLVAELNRRFSTNQNTVTVGCSQILDPLTQVKVKLNNQGTLSTIVQHEIIPKSLITVHTEFETKALDRSFKFGMSYALQH